MADTTSAGEAAHASPVQNSCARLVDRDEVATFMERYAARLVNGPLPKEYGTPINRHRYSEDSAADIQAVVRSLAQAVRTGVDTPEADWPLPGVAS